MVLPSSTVNSPGAQPGQPEGSGRPSVEKDTTQGSQPAAATEPETGPESTDSKTAPAATTAAATDEKDKQPAEGATATSQTEDAAKATPPAYEPPTLDLTAAGPPADQAITNVTTATGAVANSAPTAQNPDPSPDPEKQPEPDPLDEERRRRLLIVHLRLAKFFSWILLLAFVILPGTFSKDNEAVSTKPLFAAVYVCTILNACAISWLWYQRRNDPEFLYLNLFLPGLTNSFSGLITTLVNLWAVRKGHLGAATTTTIIVTCLATAIYGVACVNFRPKHLSAQAARLNRGIYV